MLRTPTLWQRFYAFFLSPNPPSKVFHDSLEKTIGDLESTYIARNLERIDVTHRQNAIAEKVAYLRGIAATGIFPPNPLAALQMGKTERKSVLADKGLGRNIPPPSGNSGEGIPG